jgi:hypothetical protein
MFQQFKEENKKLLRLKLKSALKIEQISVVCKCGHRIVLSKRQVWMSIFHIINFKKKIHGHRDPGFFLMKN